MTHTIPDTSRSKVDQDLFIYGIETFQVTVDYYSDNFELNLMQVATTESVIKATKSHFAGHGIADIITDNGPQYASDQFAAFTREWEFQHTTCSPLHSQSNGKAESAVKIAKNLVKKAKQENKHLQMALLEWRNTPDIDNLNPTQKLISRRTGTTIPTAKALLKPEVVEGVHDNIKRKRQPDQSYLRQERKTIARASNWRNSTLSAGKPQSSMGSRVAKVGPCSYLIETDNGNLYRRNRKFIRQDPSQGHQQPIITDSSSTKQSSPLPKPADVHPEPTAKEERKSQQPQTLVTRSGRVSVRPLRFADYV